MMVLTGYLVMFHRQGNRNQDLHDTGQQIPTRWPQASTRRRLGLSSPSSAFRLRQMADRRHSRACAAGLDGTGPLVLLTDFLNPAFVGPLWFFALCAVGLIVCSLLWTAERPGRITCIVSAAILVAPFAVTQMYGPYTLRSVDVVPGYQLDWLTQPQGYFASTFKSAQCEHDISGCRYRLHGWSGANQLYYRSDCRNDLWRYDPLSLNRPQRIDLLPAGFAPSTGIFAMQVRAHGGDTLWVTRIVEESVSPDGVFRAVVIQDSFYGPFDVIVVQPAEP